MRIVKFKIIYRKGEVSSGWLTLDYEFFKERISYFMSQALIINARIFEPEDAEGTINSKYKMVDAWDWLRMGVFPSYDAITRERAQQEPGEWKKTKEGVWHRRSRLITSSHQSTSASDDAK